MDSKNPKNIPSNYAFIDSQNLNLGTKYSGWELDFGKFRLFLRNKYNVKKAFLFIGYIEGNTSLYRYLQDSGYILIFKNVLEIKNGEKITYKGNVDAELVLHAMIEINNYHKAVVVSGDGDFFCLIEYLQEANKLEKVIVPNRKYSSLLKKYAKYVYSIAFSKKKLRIVNKANAKKK
ncbi:NYN domain-containing protein [Candidatus Dojkabacteria bacterium]|uniref:NYN domain-containing protein n=1 Tax=Candidatus Dojkabacteria bacterium TaxID=2099670 RepID=A0A955KUQ7_9BACT|nr:NYN domain-containing protein [Candidatus Dojkabacteria bacterium]